MASNDRSPLVCVCLPTYNAASTIVATLESLAAQRYRRFQIDVVDNASTDDTVAIARHYAAAFQHLQVHCHKKNIGAEGNFTRCIRLAGGTYTAIYHSDDVYDPDIIAKQVAFLEAHPDAGAVFTTASIIDRGGKRIGIRAIPAALANKSPKLYGFEEIFKCMLREGNFLMTPSAMVRTALYRGHIRQWNAGRYASSADLDVWLRIALVSKIGIIDEQLLSYRMSPASVTYAASRSAAKRDDLFLVLDRYVSHYRQLLSRSDLTNYQVLNLHRDVVRSVNLIIENRPKETRTRLREHCTWRTIGASLASRADMKYLATGLALLVMSCLPLGPRLRRAVFLLRFRQ